MTIKHVLPPPERRAFGQSRRKQVRRQEQKRWSASDRQTDPIDALAVSAVGRVPALGASFGLAAMEPAMARTGTT